MPARVVTLILWIFFALPQFGISLNPASAGVLALTLSTAAFNCEVWRGGLIAFPCQEYDAALAPFGLRLRNIVLPQVWCSCPPGWSTRWPCC